MAYFVSNVTVTPVPVEVSSGIAICVPTGDSAFALDFATITGFVSFLGDQNTPAGRPANGQLWPRGDTLA